VITDYHVRLEWLAEGRGARLSFLLCLDPQLRKFVLDYRCFLEQGYVKFSVTTSMMRNTTNSRGSHGNLMNEVSMFVIVKFHSKY
jgi:hypothetical protein